MAEASKASTAKDEIALGAPSAEPAIELDLPPREDLPGRAAIGGAARAEAVDQVPAAQPLFSAAANDDIADINTHLRQLGRNGGLRPEASALIVTAVAAFICGCLLLVFGTVDSLQWPQLLVLTFVAAATLFFVISTAIRQRATQVSLTSLLRTAVHLAEPEAAERQRLALIPERYRAEITALDRATTRTGDRVAQMMAAMNKELDSFQANLKRTQDEVGRSLEELSVERAAIVTNSESLRHVLANVHGNLSKDLRSIAESLELLFATKSEGLIAVIDQRNKDFIRNYLEAEERAIASLKQMLDQALIGTIERYETNNDRFLVALARRLEDYDGRLTRQIKDSFGRAETQVSNICARAVDISSNASREVENLMRRAEEATEQRSASLQAMLAANIINLSQAFKANAAELEAAIGDASIQMHDLIQQSRIAREDVGSQIVEFQTSVIQPLDHLTAAFGEKSRSIASNILIQVDALNEAASEAASQMAVEYEAGTLRLRATRDQSVQDIRRCMDELIEECIGNVDRCAAAIAQSTERLGQAQQARRKLGQAGVAFVRSGVDRSKPAERDKPQTPAATVESPAPAPAPLAPTSPAPNALPPTPLPPPASTPGGQSWISQLLARVDAASSPPEPVALERPKSIEAIASVLNDIDTLIVTEEAAAAWDRFRERNVSSFEAAFTPEGRVALRAIRDQIGKDERLYAFVEAYLDKFELLIKEAYAAADENALVSYMSSPSGKVYTFLARAIERI